MPPHRGVAVSWILGEGAGRDARATAGWEAGATKCGLLGLCARGRCRWWRGFQQRFIAPPTGREVSFGAAFPGFHPGLPGFHSGLTSCRPFGASRWYLESWEKARAGMPALQPAGKPALQSADSRACAPGAMSVVAGISATFHRAAYGARGLFWGCFPRVSPGAEFMPPPPRGVAVVRALWPPTLNAKYAFRMGTRVAVVRAPLASHPKRKVRV